MEKQEMLRNGSSMPELKSMSPEQRREAVLEARGLGSEWKGVMRGGDASQVAMADRMVENAIGVITIPYGIATNFIINGKESLIPMASEEPSVIAAASNAAKMARSGGGFRAEANDEWWGRGTIYITDLQDPDAARLRVINAERKLRRIANRIMRERSSTTVSKGGGVMEIDARRLKTMKDTIAVEVFVDTRDSGGQNTINTVLEAMTEQLIDLSGGRALMRINTNYDDRKMVKATATFRKEEVGGEKVVNDIVKAYEVAMADPYRAATFNKGIMNGIVAVALVTKQDTRAIEAAAHARASHYPTSMSVNPYTRTRYGPLCSWRKDENGDLFGLLEMPMPVARVGGATMYPEAQLGFKILDVDNVKELAEAMACVGLANNLAAQRALVCEGIQEGHMKLHNRKRAQ